MISNGWLFILLTVSLKLFCAASDTKILICGVGKNVESALENTIDSIEKLGARFTDYTVIIYENNSTDNSAKILQEWALRNNKVRFISEILSNAELVSGTHCSSGPDSPCRFEVIAKARNKVLAIAKESTYKDYAYLIMADLDFITPWPIDEIVRSIESKGDWDGIFANGMNDKEEYYDRYAFRNKRFPLGPELIGKHFWLERRNIPIKFAGRKGLIPVFSAFGGLAIYKRASILNSVYSGYVTQSLKQDYKNLMALLPNRHPHLQQYRKLHGLPSSANPSSMPIKFCIDRNESCQRFPYVCEHVALHAAMRLQGCGKFYINPNMIMRYTHSTVEK